MQLNGKTFVLTGATGGIGAAMAKRLSAAGANLVLLGRNRERLENLQRELGAQRHSYVAGDLTDITTRYALVKHCRALPASIDGVINNAGSSVFAPLEATGADELQSLLTINLLVPMLVTRDLLQLLRKREHAAIVNVGSTFGSIGYPGFSGYCASKFGLRGFTEALRRELADSNISVHYLAPRATHTDLNSPVVDALNEALGNAVDDPHIVADALVALLENENNTRYLGWPEKLFVRINQILPGIVDNALKKQLSVIRSFFPQKGIEPTRPSKALTQDPNLKLAPKTGA